jgi:hypothetical protein
LLSASDCEWCSLRSRNSDTNTYGNGDRNSDSNSYRDCHGYSYGNSNCYPYPDSRPNAPASDSKTEERR